MESIEEKIKEKGYTIEREIGVERVKLEVGEMIIGEYMGIDENHAMGPSVILQKNNDIVTMPLSTMLKNKLILIKSGTHICIEREEDIQTKKGRTVKNYRIYILEKGGKQ